MAIKEDESHREVWFTQCNLSGGSQQGTVFRTFRAPDGYMYELIDVEANVRRIESTGSPCHFQMYDGFTDSIWGGWPGIQNQETLTVRSFSPYEEYHYRSLNNWRCKEYTASWKNQHETNAPSVCMIVYFRLKKMTKEETYEYAVKQPKYKFARGGPSTLDPRDE